SHRGSFAAPPRGPFTCGAALVSYGPFTLAKFSVSGDALPPFVGTPVRRKEAPAAAPRRSSTASDSSGDGEGSGRGALHTRRVQRPTATSLSARSPRVRGIDC